MSDPLPQAHRSSMNPPIVAMVTPRFLPLTGGLEVHVREVAIRLLARGVTVSVITTDPSGQLSKREIVDGIDVRRLPAWPPRTDLHYAAGLARAISEVAPDVIHIQGIHTLTAPLAMMAARRARLPYAVTFHTGGHRSGLRRSIRPLQWRLLRPLLRRASALIAVSQFEASLFHSAMGSAAPQILVIRNGGVTSTQRQQPTKVDPTLVLSIGRLERYKGHHRAIEALSALRERIPEARLLILGSGSYEGQLRGLAARLGLAEAVEIRSIPASSRGELVDAIAAAGVIVLLSEYESHPVAVMEALSLRRPVVVAATTGLLELAEAGSVRSVPINAPPGDVADVLANELQEPTSPTTTLPTWDECVDQLLEVYERIKATPR
jgi:glycosyltransferase involved in cell wall biosynthesis